MRQILESMARCARHISSQNLFTFATNTMHLLNAILLCLSATFFVSIELCRYNIEQYIIHGILLYCGVILVEIKITSKLALFHSKLMHLMMVEE